MNSEADPTRTRFEGKTAMVTGAGSGIGAEIARRLLREGAWVLAADLDPDQAPDGCLKIQVDVTEEAAIADAVGLAVRQRGRLDILVNNAGIGSIASVADCSLEEWERVFAVNCRGIFLGCKHGVRQMLDQGAGVIVNTASVAGLIGMRDRAAYCASKGAVVTLTKQVAIQYAGRGIRCNCICPGTVDTPWVGRLVNEVDDPEGARAALVSRQPLGRLGTAGEVAAAACYLASAEASFITGTALVIDGGILAG